MEEALDLSFDRLPMMMMMVVMMMMIMMMKKCAIGHLTLSNRQAKRLFLNEVTDKLLHRNPRNVQYLLRHYIFTLYKIYLSHFVISVIKLSAMELTFNLQTFLWYSVCTDFILSFLINIILSSVDVLMCTDYVPCVRIN